MLLTLVYFLLALLLLVTIHEYGHFQVARFCGIKVIRFSFGFGKVLASWRDKKGTEYAWSLLPIGGYVKMLDEAEGTVAVQEKHLAFNNQSVWARMAVILAGPLFNFLFAWFALWLVLMIGMHSLAPVIASLKPNSIAAHAGLKPRQEIVALNGVNINSWRDMQYVMIPLIGSSDQIAIKVKSLDNGRISEHLLPLSEWHLESKSDLLSSLGIEPFIPKIRPIIGSVLPDSPAELAGLHAGDKIVKINGIAVDDWVYIVSYVQKRPGRSLTLDVMRGDQPHQITVVTGSKVKEGKTEGFIGVYSQKMDWPSNWLRIEKEAPIPALGLALKQTLGLIRTTTTLMGRLVTGKLGLNSISGPVGIAQGAGDSARGGLPTYLLFLAVLSVSLGVLNLLPIPLLDGGHLLYCFLEVLTRKPLSEKAKMVGFYLGALLLATIMCVALLNDIGRLTE